MPASKKKKKKEEVPEPKPWSTLMVAGKEVAVRWVELEGKWGDFDLDGPEIRLSIDLQKKPVEFQYEILAHELTHAALGLAGVSEVLGDDNEEAVCRNVQQILFPVFRQLLVDVG